MRFAQGHTESEQALRSGFDPGLSAPKPALFPLTPRLSPRTLHCPTPSHLLSPPAAAPPHLSPSSLSPSLPLGGGGGNGGATWWGREAVAAERPGGCPSWAVLLRAAPGVRAPRSPLRAPRRPPRGRRRAGRPAGQTKKARRGGASARGDGPWTPSAGGPPRP